MSGGFLGYNTSLMLDVVVSALVLVVPTLVYSIYLAKFRRNYLVHRNLQVALGVVLLIAVGAFEIDMQWVHHGWENVVEKSRGAEWLQTAEFARVHTILRVHLVFAISTPLLWGVTLALALKRFPSPPQPNAHSPLHKKLAWASAVDITATSVTGLIFYYFAFIA